MKKKKDKLKIIPAGKTKINGVTVYTPQVTVDPKYKISIPLKGKT
jgi:ribosomal protein S4